MAHHSELHLTRISPNTFSSPTACLGWFLSFEEADDYDHPKLVGRDDDSPETSGVGGLQIAFWIEDSVQLRLQTPPKLPRSGRRPAGFERKKGTPPPLWQRGQEFSDVPF